jgi:hypothetical protein
MDNTSGQMHFRAAGVAFAGIVFGVLSQASLIATPTPPQLALSRQAVTPGAQSKLSVQDVSLALEVADRRSEAAN